MVESEVLVVGGGPAGSSVAFALARAGVDVTVVDRARFPRPKPCAEYLSPQASRILADMGALDGVERSGAAALAGIHVRAPNGAVIRGDFVAAHGFRGFRDRGLSVRREVLDAILLDRARDAGARVEEGVRVTDVARDASGRVTGVTTLAAGSGTQRRARLVIGADGLRSIVARRLGLARTARWPRRLALVTHYYGVGDMSQHGEMHVERDGYVGIADVGAGLTTVALVVPMARASEIAGDRAGFLTRWLAAHPHLGARFERATRATPVVATGPFASHARRAWAAGAALVGDAADFFDPFTGEGVYSALRGGEMLAAAVIEALAESSSTGADRAIARYDAARRAEFGGKWIVERVIGAVVGAAPLINRAARKLSARKDLADLLVGVTGNFVPPREVIRLSYLWGVFGLSGPSQLSRAPSPPMIDPDTFRSALGRFASGITIVTVRDDAGGDHGMTVSAFCSVSLDPPLVLVCIDHEASMHDLLLTHPAFGISFLAAGQESYSRRFTAEESERFDGIAYQRGESGVVLLEDALAHLECTPVEHYVAGDHTIFVARVDGAVARAGQPLLYYRGGYAQLER